MAAYPFVFREVGLAPNPVGALFCGQILLPRQVSEWAPAGVLSDPETRVRAALCEGRIRDALEDFRCQHPAAVADPDDEIRFLFASADCLLAVGQRIAADRCLDAALRVLSGGRHDQKGLRFQEWLTLATSAMFKSDWQSCALWLRQSERCLHQRSDDLSHSSFQLSAGDLLAVRGCASAVQGKTDEAQMLLVRAAASHGDALASLSAALDLILLSRVLRFQGQDVLADVQLQAAEGHLAAVGEQEPRGKRLWLAIRSDRERVQRASDVAAMARWN